MTGLARTTALFLALTAVLAGCTPAPEPMQDTPAVVPFGYDPVTGQPTGVSGSLNNKEPDTCKASTFQYLIGQTEAEVRAAGITRPTRMVTPTSIVDQEEYDSFRINFQTDATGRIFRITCG